MAVATLTEQLDNLYTTTWHEMKGEAVDNIIDSLAFYFWLRESDAMEPVEGGTRLSESLRYAKSDNVTWFTKGSTVPMSDKEFLTVAHDDWRYVSDTIVRFGIDDQQNRGRHRLINLMDAKLASSEDTLSDEMEARLVGLASDGTNYPNGLQDLVADDPTASTSVHGINQSTYSWWRNQTHNLTGNSFAVHGTKEMRTMLNECMNNRAMDRPNIIVSDQTSYERYEDDVTEQKRIVNKTLGDAGFENIEFKGVPMIWSSKMSQRMYFLNTRFIKLKYDPAMFFDMTNWKEIPNQPQDRVAQIVTAMNFMTSRRRVHGVIYNIDTE